MVGTETVMRGISIVAVNGRVGIRVDVGLAVSVGVAVTVGGSGVAGDRVSEGAANVGEESGWSALCVSPAITVCAAAVLMEPVSGVEKAGTAQARLAINNAMTGK